MRFRFLLVLTTAILTASPTSAQEAPECPETVSPTAKLIEVYSGNEFYEGPTWDPESGRLFFTAFHRGSDILRLDFPGKAVAWAVNTQGVNGTFLSREGRLLGAQAFGHRIVSYDLAHQKAQEPKVLAHDPGWNQPNDLCQTPDGTIYFTDPNFEKPERSAVYLLTPQGEVRKIITEMPAPNGIIASNDGKTLYISDSHEALWRSYPIQPNGTVAAGKVFFNPDTPNRTSPDGMTIDERGNLYFTGRGGVWVVTPAGVSLGLIPIEEFCTNAAFGGRDNRMLYITCSKKIYGLKMAVRGARIAPPPEPEESD